MKLVCLMIHFFVFIPSIKYVPQLMDRPTIGGGTAAKLDEMDTKDEETSVVFSVYVHLLTTQLTDYNGKSSN